MTPPRPAAVFALALSLAVSLAGASAPVFGQDQQATPRRDAVHLPPLPRDGVGPEGTVLPILIYHSIRPYAPEDTHGARRWIATPETLESELSWLRDNGYTSVTFEALRRNIEEGTPLPPRPVILSFDDDWQSQFDNAVPLLHKYGFTATFFVWVRAVGRVHHMSWDEIRQLDAEGMEIGCHTLTHLVLPRLKNDEQLTREIVAARDQIVAHLGHPVTTFAYPFGQYDERVVQAAREAGFTTARSTWPGVYHTRDGLLSLTGLVRTDSAVALEDALRQQLAEARRRADAGSGLAEPQ
ncbi:MAG TPA: polysaccharide deacetylase family protein [Spirochaetia bacterium]|nr:polysaccharide deacetylase family protein [Spirochaetia bacterium]